MSTPATARRDVALVFIAKTARTFCYGFLGVAFPVYLSSLGMNAVGVGASVTMTLVGSAILTWAVRRPVERWGARTALLGLGALSVLAAVIFLFARQAAPVVVAAMLANLAVGTGETGPFLSIEQVIIARATTAKRRTMSLSVYNFLGYAAGALGAALLRVLSNYEVLFLVFLGASLLQCALFAGLAQYVVQRPKARRGGLLPSSPHVRKMAALFSLDSFGGGFITQALVAYYFHERFGLSLGSLGLVFFGAQILAAISLLLAARLANRYGLLNTMVFSHLTSNALLIAIAFAPAPGLAVGLYLTRNLLSQMDVPTRQAYLMAVVEDHEREDAAISTTLARTVTQAVSPAITGWIMQTLALSAPFVIGGAIKITYDLLIYANFRRVPLQAEGS